MAAMGAIILNGAKALAAGDYRLYKVTPLVVIQPEYAPTIENSNKMGTAGINSDGQVVYTRQRTRNCPAFTAFTCRLEILQREGGPATALPPVGCAYTQEIAS